MFNIAYIFFVQFNVTAVKAIASHVKCPSKKKLSNVKSNARARK